MFNAADVVVGIIVTWGLGLVPAWVARYWWKRAPLSKRSANWIAGLSCFFFAIAFLILKGALGEANPRISPAWILVFFTQRWIMTRGSKSDEELVTGLREMIADPATAEDRRQRARGKLAQLEAKILKRAPQQRLASAGGLRITERREPAGHHLRPANLALDHDDTAEPKVRLPQSSERVPESWRRYGRLAAYAAGIVVALDILLMVSGYRLLIHEKMIPPRTADLPDGWSLSGMIDCSYWTGRSVKVVSRPYGPSEGEIDECRFLYSPQQPLAHEVVAMSDSFSASAPQPDDGPSIDMSASTKSNALPLQSVVADEVVVPEAVFVPHPPPDTNCARVRLPKGVSIDVPRDWWVLDDQATSWLKSHAETALDLSGMTVPDDQETDLIRANSLPRSTYATLAVTSSPSDWATQAEVQHLSSSDLAVFDAQLPDGFSRMLGVINQHLLDFGGAKVARLASYPTLVIEYRRTGQNGPVIVQQNRIFTGTQEVSVNLSYRESEAARWRPVVARIRQSITIAGRGW